MTYHREAVFGEIRQALHTKRLVEAADWILGEPNQAEQARQMAYARDIVGEVLWARAWALVQHDSPDAVLNALMQWPIDAYFQLAVEYVLARSSNFFNHLLETSSSNFTEFEILSFDELTARDVACYGILDLDARLADIYEDVIDSLTFNDLWPFTFLGELDLCTFMDVEVDPLDSSTAMVPFFLGPVDALQSLDMCLEINGLLLNMSMALEPGGIYRFDTVELEDPSRFVSTWLMPASSDSDQRAIISWLRGQVV